MIKSKIIKINGILFSIILFSAISYSQNNQAFIRVTDEQNIPIPDVSIFLQDSFVCLTNIDGGAKISHEKGEINIALQHISYETTDTQLIFPTQNALIKIKLSSKNFELDEITISPPGHITDAKYIADIYTYQNQIIVLNSKNGQSTLRLYDSLGYNLNFAYNIKQKGQFQTIKKGFANGQYYLIGKNECLPFTIQPDMSIIEDEKMTRLRFDKLYGSIMLFNDSILIKREISELGNKVDIYTYGTKDLNRTLLYTIFDKETAKEARNNYRIIKSIYLQGLKNKGPKAIDFGVERMDVTKDPNWNGDILDLLVSNDQMPHIVKYQQATEGIKLSSVLADHHFYILDNVNSTILKTRLTEKIAKENIELPKELKYEYQFLLTPNRVCIENGENMYCLDKELFSWRRIEVQGQHVFHTKRKLMIGNNVFILGRKSVNNVNNQVFMFHCQE